MAAQDIKVKAEARKRLEGGDKRFEGYRTMDTAKLEKLLKSPAGVKGKGSSNGTKGKGAATAVVKGKGKASTAKTPAKGKASPAKGKAKSAPAKGKSTSQKSSPTKGRATAAKGKAKRPTTGTSSKGKLPDNVRRLGENALKALIKERGLPALRGKFSKARALELLEGSTAKSTAKGKPATAKRGAVAFSSIDNKSVNWKLESNVGRSGKRKTVLDALRSNKGDKDKAFAAVKRFATKWYPGKSKDEADKTVRWLVGRVAYDYVMSTDQHTPGNRSEYGTSDAPQNVRRREARQAAKPKRRAPAKKSSGTKGTARKPAAKGKATAAKGRATKGKGKRK
jgi:hypothetical protein